MLYILNKVSGDSLRQLKQIAANDDEAAVLLISDAVFLSSEGNLEKFAPLEAESFASRPDVEARRVTPGEDVELLDYDGMAALIEDFDKIVTL